MQAIPMVGFIFVNTHQTPPLVALFGPRLFMMDGERGDDYEDYDDFGLVSRGRGWRYGGDREEESNGGRRNEGGGQRSASCVVVLLGQSSSGLII